MFNSTAVTRHLLEMRNRAVAASCDLRGSRKDLQETRCDDAALKHAAWVMLEAGAVLDEVAGWLDEAVVTGGAAL